MMSEDLAQRSLPKGQSRRVVFCGIILAGFASFVIPALGAIIALAALAHSGMSRIGKS